MFKREKQIKGSADNKEKMIDYYVQNYKSKFSLIKQVENQILELDSDAIMSILEICELDDAKRRLFVNTICLKDCDKDTARKLVKYVDDFSKFEVKNLQKENIFAMLYELVAHSKYFAIFDIVKSNNLGEEYIDEVVNYSLKLSRVIYGLLNKPEKDITEESYNAKVIYDLLESLIVFKKTESFEIDLTKHMKKVESALIKSNDLHYIIKAGIYLDDNLLDLLFKNKLDLLVFLITNDYPEGYIKKVKEIYSFEKEKNNLNSEIKEIIREYNDEKTLNLKPKKEE